MVCSVRVHLVSEVGGVCGELVDFRSSWRKAVGCRYVNKTEPHFIVCSESCVLWCN